ncbi:MAG: diaminopimelate epimerase [Desulfomonilia bacterium]
MVKIPFTKMSGTGNDFIVIDDITISHDMDWGVFASQYCPRRISVGADGVLVLQKSDSSDFIFRIFNADGSEAEMCGNGARCAALFAFDHGLAGRTMSFSTMAGVVSAKVDTQGVSIQMTDASILEKDVEIDLVTGKTRVHFINTGVPHTVYYTDHLPSLQINELGRSIRHHPRFAPAGTNVDFVQVENSHHIRVRTYERGVEAETLACGTGAVASALMSTHLGKIPGPPVHITMPGGTLTIDFNMREGVYHNVWLSGPVTTVYTGEILVNQ